jgi:hypothetical protein
MILILFLDDVGAIFAERIQHNIAMDMAAKAREDPLFAIRYFMGLAGKLFMLFLWHNNVAGLGHKWVPNYPHFDKKKINFFNINKLLFTIKTFFH